MTSKTLIIIGPTAGGKTALAEALAVRMNGELINLDMAQMYKPFAIGTAKPMWQSTSFAQHMFDIIDEPMNYDAARYRECISQLIPAIAARGHVPILVGGTGFYAASLFLKLPPDTRPAVPIQDTVSWEQLRDLDPVRAQQIHPHDTYRIARAFEQFSATGMLPSVHKPVFNPVTSAAQLVLVTRDRQEIIERINQRVVLMMEQGWLDEVATLSPEWQRFCLEKKIIGYNELLAYRAGECTLEHAIERIKIRTRQYAKRQVAYAHMLMQQLKQYPVPQPIEINLSRMPSSVALDLIEDLMHRLP